MCAHGCVRHKRASLLRAQSLPLPILSLGLPRPRGGCRPFASERSAPAYLPLIT